MKFGANTCVWVSSFRTEHAGQLADKVKRFGFILHKLARAVCIWREIVLSQDAIAQEGLAFLKKTF